MSTINATVYIDPLPLPRLTLYYIEKKVTYHGEYKSPTIEEIVNRDTALYANQAKAAKFYHII